MNTEISEIKKIVENVDGWLSNKEGELLYNLAKSCSGRGVIIEIGSWKGRSTIWLGKGSQSGSNNQVYAIDPHRGSMQTKKEHPHSSTFAEFCKNIGQANLETIVTPIVATSKQAAIKINKPVELIFIDGDHTYNLVKLDFELWFPKLTEGGFIVFHDTIEYPGVRKVVEKFIYKSRHFKNVKFVDSISYAQKIKHNSLKDMLRNRYIYVLLNLEGFISKLYLPRLTRTLWKKLISLMQF